MSVALPEPNEPNGRKSSYSKGKKNLKHHLSLATRTAVQQYKEQTQSFRETVVEEATTDYNHVVGRFNSYRYITTHHLAPGVVPEDEQDLVEGLGAIPQPDGSYVIPSDVNVDHFQPWFKEVPPDLRDQRAQMKATSDGHTLESYLLNDDTYKGGDSMALPLVFLAFPIITALAYALGAIHPALMMLTLLLLIPHIWTITQSEGIGSAWATTITSSLFPLAVATTASGASMGGLSFLQAFVSGKLLQGVMSGGMTTMIGLAVGALLLLFVVGVVILAFAGGNNPNKSRFGGAWEGFKYVLKWGLVFAVALGVTFSLPSIFQPGVIFALACLNAMFYTQREYDTRTKSLARQGILYNLAQMDPTTHTHSAKEAQARAAANDSTPFILMGTSMGHLAKLDYSFAPDAGLPFGLSVLDLAAHFHVFGETGMGKTMNFMRPFAVQLRRFGFGGYFDCGKGALVNDIRKLMDIIIEPGVQFALLEGMNAQEVSLGLNNVASAEGEKHGNDAIWREGAAMLIDHMTVLHEALHEHEKNARAFALRKIKRLRLVRDYTFVKIQQARQAGDDSQVLMLERDLTTFDDGLAYWSNVADAQEEWLWNLDTLDRIKTLVDERRQSKGQFVAGEKLMDLLAWLGYNANAQRLSQDPESIHKGIGAGHLLDHTIKYFLNTWPQMDEGQRSSFSINVDQKIQPLMRGAKLTDENGVPWSRLVTGVDVTRASFGFNVGVSLPAIEHGLSGQLVSSLVKQRIYKLVRHRMKIGEKAWRAEGHKEMVIMWDEAQALVTDDELTLLPQARSAGVMFIFASQNVDNIYARLGSARAQQYLAAFSSLACLKSSPATHEYMESRLGEAKLVTYKDRVMGVDYRGALEKMLDAPYNDPNHPNFAGMRKIARLGGEKFQVLAPPRNGVFHYSNKALAVDDIELANGITVPTGATVEVRPLFTQDEYANLLTEKGKAICYVRRAGVPRVDLVRMNPVSEDAYR